MKHANLREFKEKKGLTNARLADMFGTSEIYMALLLTKKRAPSRKLALKISQQTGIPVLNLLYPN